MDIEALKVSMIEQGYEQEYINLCVEYANNLAEHNMPIIFDITHLCGLMGISSVDFYKIYSCIRFEYNTIQIPKRDGTKRNLDVPCENLKFIQRWILDNILYNCNCSTHATGFIPNRSIIDNAQLHVAQECVIGLDMKDFFPTIHFGRVLGMFKTLGYNSYLSHLLANICTYEGVLPQGAPTSPYISNIICARLDYRLSKLCDNADAKFTRYADDITVSGNRGIERLLPIIKKIVEEEGFQLNQKKERVLYSYHSQRVTGITVNTKLSPPKSLLKYMRQCIFYINKYGLRSHLERTNNLEKANYKDHLYGIAYYIKMIDIKLGEKYLNDLNAIEWEIG
jgi:RNA-directed DNA polymerase